MLHLPSGVSINLTSFPHVTLSDVVKFVYSEYMETHRFTVSEWRTARIDSKGQHAMRSGSGMLTYESWCALQDTKPNDLFFLGNDYNEDAFGSLSIGNALFDAETSPHYLAECVEVSATSLDANNSENHARCALRNHEALLRLLLKRFPTLSALMRRNTNYYAPVPPFADPHVMMQIVAKEDIANSYDDPELYWRVWDSVEDYDEGRVLVTRGLSILDDLEYKKSVYPRTWDLARNAKPGLTEYSAPDLREHDLPYINAGKAWLAPTGYNPQEQWVEYAGAPGPDDHVLPQEILHFYVWLGSEKWQDGRPLKGIRVVFPRRDIAEREKRPLLDVGCRVFYMDSSTGLDTEISA